MVFTTLEQDPITGNYKDRYGNVFTSLPSGYVRTAPFTYEYVTPQPAPYVTPDSQLPISRTAQAQNVTPQRQQSRPTNRGRSARISNKPNTQAYAQRRVPVAPQTPVVQQPVAPVVQQPVAPQTTVAPQQPVAPVVQQPVAPQTSVIQQPVAPVVQQQAAVTQPQQPVVPSTPQPQQQTAPQLPDVPIAPASSGLPQQQYVLPNPSLSWDINQYRQSTTPQARPVPQQSTTPQARPVPQQSDLQQIMLETIDQDWTGWNDPSVAYVDDFIYDTENMDKHYEETVSGVKDLATLLAMMLLGRGGFKSGGSPMPSPIPPTSPPQLFQLPYTTRALPSPPPPQLPYTTRALPSPPPPQLPYTTRALPSPRPPHVLNTGPATTAYDPVPIPIAPAPSGIRQMQVPLF